MKEIETLSQFAKTQPHAAFAVYTHCTLHKLSFISRTTPGISELLQPVEDAILFRLLPSLTGRDAFSPLGRELMALPACLGGLGIPNPAAALQVSSAYDNSKTLSDPLISLIIWQTPELSEQTVKTQSSSKSELRKKRLDGEKRKHQELMETMPAKLKQAVEVGSEKNASTWLTALPVEEHDFLLNKGEFHDALHLRYRWQPSRLPRNCVCSKCVCFTVDHSMICPYGHNRKAVDRIVSQCGD